MFILLIYEPVIIYLLSDTILIELTGADLLSIENVWVDIIDLDISNSSSYRFIILFSEPVTT